MKIKGINDSENLKKGLNIIGTEPNSYKSVEKNKIAIYDQKPEIVVIELDEERYNYLMGKESDIQTKVNDFVVDSFNEFIVYHFDDSVEMKAAIDVANDIGAEIALIDRDVQIPISKFLTDIGMIKRIKLLLRLNSSYDEFGLSFETLENLFKEFSLSLFNEHFVKRRNAFIAKKLLPLQEENVLAVVSAKNKEGIQYYLDNPDEIPPMEVLLDSEKTKKKGFFSRLFKR